MSDLHDHVSSSDNYDVSQAIKREQKAQPLNPRIHRRKIIAQDSGEGGQLSLVYLTASEVALEGLLGSPWIDEKVHTGKNVDKDTLDIFHSSGERASCYCDHPTGIDLIFLIMYLVFLIVKNKWHKIDRRGIMHIPQN